MGSGRPVSPGRWWSIAPGRRSIWPAAEIAGGGEPDVNRIAADLVAGLQRSATHKVINATGVLLHTNLGRAPLSSRAADAALKAARLVHQSRAGSRPPASVEVAGRISEPCCEPSPVPRTLSWSTTMRPRCCSPSPPPLRAAAVPVARGELIEIGGSFRLPLVMEAGGARLVEVGTTNRTRLDDYATALQIHDCGAVLKVHPSNYRIDGFVTEVPIEDLAALARDRGIPLIHDLGSGLLDAETPWLTNGTPSWLSAEPGARQSIEAGADLVTFSGDKLVGGPQAGIIVGSAGQVDRLRQQPAGPSPEDRRHDRSRPDCDPRGIRRRGSASNPDLAHG